MLDGTTHTVRVRVCGVTQTHVQHTHSRVVILSKLDTMQIHYNTLGHLFLSLSLTPVVFLFGG